MFRGLIVLAGLLWTGTGLFFYVFRESAADDEPSRYWLLFQGREPYIRNADARVEHVKFKAKALLSLGIPQIILGIFLPAPIMEIVDGFIFGVGLLLVFVLYLVFIGDAIDRDIQSRIATQGLTEAEVELIKELEEKGKLED